MRELLILPRSRCLLVGNVHLSLDRLVGDSVAVPASASHKSKKQQVAAAAKAAADAAALEVATAQADFITLAIPSLLNKEINLGSIRHRILQPLLKGKKSGEESICEGIIRAVGGSSLSIGERMALWEGVGVIGFAS